MKFFNSSYMFRLYNSTFWSNVSFRSPFMKYQRSMCRNYSCPLPAGRISKTLLNNPGVRSYLEKFVSEDYSNTMSKPNVTALINTIRSLKVDLQSLNEFDTGQYYNKMLFKIFGTVGGYVI